MKRTQYKLGQKDAQTVENNLPLTNKKSEYSIKLKSKILGPKIHWLISILIEDIMVIFFITIIHACWALDDSKQIKLESFQKEALAIQQKHRKRNFFLQPIKTESC